jgi:hypothetical protein
VDAISSSVSRAAAELGVVSSRDYGKGQRSREDREDMTYKTRNVSLSDLLNRVLHLVQ